VIGKRFVSVAANKDPGARELEADPGGTGGNVRVNPAVADDPKCLGVSTYDAEIGSTTTVVRGGFVVPVTAGVALVFGDPIGPGANGKAVKPGASAKVWGISLSDAAVDQDAIVALY